jgi:hypothetical protein
MASSRGCELTGEGGAAGEGGVAGDATCGALALEIGSDGTGTATRPVVDAAPRGAASSAAWVGWMVIPSVRERLGMCGG